MKRIGGHTDFGLPREITDYRGALEACIEREIKPLEQKHDNIRFFDHPVGLHEMEANIDANAPVRPDSL